MKVFVYVDTNYDVGHPDHLKVFEDDTAVQAWLDEHDPEGWRLNMM